MWCFSNRAISWIWYFQFANAILIEIISSLNLAFMGKGVCFSCCNFQISIPDVIPFHGRCSWVQIVCGVTEQAGYGEGSWGSMSHVNLDHLFVNYHSSGAIRPSNLPAPQTPQKTLGMEEAFLFFPGGYVTLCSYEWLRLIYPWFNAYIIFFVRSVYFFLVKAWIL